MWKQMLYPKTKRYNPEETFIVTEKLDGSCLGFFKWDEELFVAQRNNIFRLSDLEDQDIKRILYKGLYKWLKKHGEDLKNQLMEMSCIFGEWIAMGVLQYPEEFRFNFYQFAKANISEVHRDEFYTVLGFEIENLYYDHDLFIFSFANKEVPEYIREVPVVWKTEAVTLESLDELYTEYTTEVDRLVEGFVIYYGGSIRKYVRHKGRKLIDHFWNK